MGRAVAFQPPDLTDIIDRAAKDWRWSPTQKKQARVWYERFLELVYDHPGGMVYIITPEADQLWHTHITFTVRYREYCDGILGFYLEHTPDKYAPTPTAKLVAAVKGVYAAKNWPTSDINSRSLTSCH
ncbi:MAG TPA: hypothetical protein VKE27_04095 [Candidatus Dormibacteraeota bacterium]|nr:hypothetical protein [Candidatus Dormibacteraeota bacterium]